jgi:hypothetical protein
MLLKASTATSLVIERCVRSSNRLRQPLFSEQLENQLTPLNLSSALTPNVLSMPTKFTIKVWPTKLYDQ